MSQFTRFCGVKFLAWKSGCVKFLTNIMSEKIHILYDQFLPHGYDDFEHTTPWYDEQ